MRGFIFVIIFLFQINAYADKGFNFTYSAGLSFGGEKLDETTTGESLKSGGLIFGSLGSTYIPDNENWQLSLAIGYHFDSLDANNGSADFSRVTMEAIPFYVIDNKFRFGIGLMKLSSIQFSRSVDAQENINLRFKDTTAPVIEFGWKLDNQAWLSIRYIKIDYEVSRYNGIDVTGLNVDTLAGSNMGIYISNGF